MKEKMPNYDVFGADPNAHIPSGRLIWDLCSVENIKEAKETISIEDLTFRELVMYIEYLFTRHDRTQVEIERHLFPQVAGDVPDGGFNKVVRLENYKEDIKEVCAELDISYKKMTALTQQDINKNHKTGTYKMNVSDKPAHWFRKNGVVPKNYDCFYDLPLQLLLGHLYQEDIKEYGYEFNK